MAEKQDSDLQERLSRYAELLRGSPHNLLSPRGLDELEARHFPESVRFATTLPTVKRVLDVGSGGGLPGLVIGMVRPDLDLHLLEATGKKAQFLDAAAAALGIQATVHHGRAEVLHEGELAGTFDVVTARAVAPLDRLVRWTAPFLRVGGRLHAIKGERWRVELEAAREACAQEGMRLVEEPDGADDAGDTLLPRVVVLERSGHRVGRTAKR